MRKRRRKRRPSSGWDARSPRWRPPPPRESAPLSVVGLLAVVGVHGEFLEALALLHHFAATPGRVPQVDTMK